MELRHLRYFVAVAEALNFTRAAAKMRVAQPALSRQMTDLEEEIGVDLLRRSPRRVTLTAEGKLFLEEARDILKRAGESLLRVRALARGEYGDLHVGYGPTPTIEILPPVLAAFQKALPGVRVLLHDMAGDEIVDGLHREEIHLAVTPWAETAHVADVEFESLRAYPLCVALPPGHPLARMKMIPLQKLAAESQITLNRQNYPGAHGLLEQLLKPLGIKPRIVLECDSGSSLVAAIESDRGIALTIPVLKLVTGKRLIYRLLRGVAQTVAVGIARVRDADLTPAGERFCQLLRSGSKAPAG